MHTAVIKKMVTRAASIVGLSGVLFLTACGDDESVLMPLGSGTNFAGPGGVMNRPDPQLSQQDNVSYWDGDGIAGAPAVTISLTEQKAYFYKGGTLVGISRISSGKDGHTTTPGTWKIIQKNPDHRSNLYGDYVDANGNKVVRDVDVNKDPRPPGTTFLGASMPHFMRFHGGEGMHAGFLPGYAASHGCVRMPDQMAAIFFDNVSVGTPVRVLP